jgi:DNA-binding LacI/PurR family transcriptional regulator
LGYQQALDELGLKMPDGYHALSDYSMQQGYEIATRMRSLTKPPTAFITYSDQIALGVLRAAADMGLTVPGDVSIIGFDDIGLASFTVPRLTTVYQDKQKIGEAAFSLIRKRLEKPDRPLENVVLPTRLMIRESTSRI